MKLICSVRTNNRQVCPLSVTGNNKHVKSTLVLCKHPNSSQYYMIHFSVHSKTGTKYEIKNNIQKVLTRFLDEGKATVQFVKPPHDLYVQADAIQLRAFLQLLRKILEGKLTGKEVCSSLAVMPGPAKGPATKLVITSRSQYPMKGNYLQLKLFIKSFADVYFIGFPRTLETLKINNISRCSLDLGILQLNRLNHLDLSDNLIECLPEAFGDLPNLGELNMTSNRLGRGTPQQWHWLKGNVSKTLHTLNLSSNEMLYLPYLIAKLQGLVTLKVDDNRLQTLPSGVGSLKYLR